MSNVGYTLRRSKRARALSITVYADGQVSVTAPYLSGLRAIERFFAEHSAWVARKVEESKGRTVVRIRRADIAALKRHALASARERIERFAPVLGVAPGAIAIRAQKSRWGSCSHNGNLSFNYKMAALPAELQDYIVVHELCHLLHFDHSKAFWAAVERVYPAHRDARKLLRDIVFSFS